MDNKFEMVAKTFQGLEEVLAEELRSIGAENVTTGRRMVAFEGTLETLYRANLQCRTALRILKPFCKFRAGDADSLYERAKEYDWSNLLSIDKTFSIDTVANSDEFKHSRFVTYRVKDAIVDWFKDRFGEDKRPGVRLNDADVLINVYINGKDVILSLDSSGESLHKRGYRVAQTEAPINEVLAAGIIMLSGWRGETPFVDPMCGSGTFLIEAALIAANINPGIYRKDFAFERWADFDAELFDRLYNDDSGERPVTSKIYGADISPKAIQATIANVKSAGVAKYIEIERRPIARWETAPTPAGMLVTNPPYGERISVADMEGLYQTIGSQLKHVFTGYHAWIIGYRDEHFAKIGLAPSQKIPLLNGALECSLREYIIFDGDRKSFVRDGGKIGKGEDRPQRSEKHREKGRFGDRPERHDRSERRERPERHERFERFERSERRERPERRDRSEKPERFERSERFDRSERRERQDRFERSSRFEKSERTERPERRGPRPETSGRPAPHDRFADRRPEKPAIPELESDNPLAKRRNPGALFSIIGREPSLPPQEGPIMRSRGWKKRRFEPTRPADEESED